MPVKLRELKLNKYWIVVLLVLFTGVWLFASNVLAYSGTGFRISEKLINSSGTSNSRLVISAGNPSIDVAMSPFPVSLSPIVGDVMRGQITTMNGFPTATVYFQWVDQNGNHLSPSWTTAIPDTFTYDITGLFAGSVQYRLVVEADGTNYASWTSMTGGLMQADDILWSIIPIILAGALLLLAWRVQASLPLIIAGLVTYTIIVALLRAFIG